MAKCPKCGRKLHIYDWQPECAGCHVNLVYYNSNENLLAESEKAEIEHAKHQPSIDRAKSATIGTKKGIIRMILFLIPIAALFLPLCKVTVGTTEKSFNAIDIYNVFASLDLGTLLKEINPLVIFALFLVIPAVCCIVFTFMQMASCSKKGQKRNIVLSSISILMVLVSISSFCIFSANPEKSYTEMILNEAVTAVQNGDQSSVDCAVHKIRNLYNDKTVDTTILEKAIKYGDAALLSADNYGLNSEEINTLKESIQKGRDILKSPDIDVDTVTDATALINSSVNTYSTLQTYIFSASSSSQDSTDGDYSDECYKNICSETEKAIVYLQNSVDRAKLIKNNETFSESSFNSLQEAIKATDDCLNTLKSGKMVVELIDDDGSGNKTDKELARDTAEFIQSKFNDLNNCLCGLTDISTLTPLTERLNTDLESSVQNKTIVDISATLGFGIYILLAIYFVQLIFNIILNKNGIEVKYTKCLIGGLPSDEYFRMVDDGVSELEIRKKMVEELTRMQNEVRAKAAEEEAEALKNAMERK